MENLLIWTPPKFRVIVLNAPQGKYDVYEGSAMICSEDFKSTLNFAKLQK